MLVLVLLRGDLCLQVLEVGDNQGDDDLDILIVESLQVVVHHGDILPQRLNLLLVLSQDLS